MSDFFISYEHTDKAWAEWIAWQLQNAGYTLVLQAWHFDAGGHFVHTIHQALETAERVITVLSPAYFLSNWTLAEALATVRQDPLGKAGRLLPIRVQPCDPPGLLAPLSYIDLVGLDEDVAHATLLSGVPRGEHIPITAPPFPGALLHPVPTGPRFPGALPPICSVPHRRNPNFIGRDQFLRTLHQAFTAGSPQALHGLGGVGKTQLVVEYVYRYTADYDVIWWVRAEKPEMLREGYADLAIQLRLSEHETHNQASMCKAVGRWLEQHTGWLLVFDNAEDQDSLLPYLPRHTAGHILITSLNPTWGAVGIAHHVTPFTSEEGEEFLLRHTKHTDQTAARCITQCLGDLPLALEQARAFIDEARMPLTEYLQLMKTSQQDLLQRGMAGIDYPYTVATTWEISMQRVQQQPAASDLLSLCAFLAPDDIPRDLFRDGLAYLPGTLAATVANGVALNEAVAVLRRYSFLEREGDVFSVHRLVQAVTRHRLAEDRRATWAEVAVRLLDSAFPFNRDDDGTWSICARLLPHALAVVDHSEKLHVAAAETIQLLNRVGEYLHSTEQFNHARQSMAGRICQRALDLAEMTYGDTHPLVAVCANSLGLVFRALGEREAARVAFERALAINKETYGESDPSVAWVLTHLGLVLHDLGSLDEAFTTLQRALEILEMNEETYGESDPSVAWVLTHLGLVLHDRGDSEEASTTLQQALKMNEETYGESHPRVAQVLTHLGRVLYDLEAWDESRTTFNRALEIDEGLYGPCDPVVASSLYNLGTILWKTGELAEARAALERALSIFTDSLGVEHPETDKTREALDALTDLL